MYTLDIHTYNYTILRWIWFCITEICHWTRMYWTSLLIKVVVTLRKKKGKISPRLMGENHISKQTPVGGEMSVWTSWEGPTAGMWYLRGTTRSCHPVNTEPSDADWRGQFKMAVNRIFYRTDKTASAIRLLPGELEEERDVLQALPSEEWGALKHVVVSWPLPHLQLSSSHPSSRHKQLLRSSPHQRGWDDHPVCWTPDRAHSELSIFSTKNGRVSTPLIDMRVGEAKVNRRKEERLNLNKIVKHREDVKYGFGSFRAHSTIHLDFPKAFDKVHLTTCSWKLKWQDPT